MDEAIGTLAAAVVGALIAVGGIYLQTRSQERRAVEDRQDARSARLFDHRRTAYAEFIAEADRMVGILYAVNDPHDPAWEPEGDDWEPLVKAVTAVQLYGSPEAVDRAREVQAALLGGSVGVPRDPDEAGHPAEARVAAFIDEARRDLGVVD